MDEPGDEKDGVDSIRSDEHRLLLDVMLGKLRVYLRLCGFDAAYAGDLGVEADDRLLEIATREERILVTRDVQLAGRADRSVLLTERAVEAQLTELREAGVELEVADRPVRCGRCNGRLEPIPEVGSTPEYAPDPAGTDCWRCRDCGQVFWRGSHWDRMRRVLE